MFVGIRPQTLHPCTKSTELFHLGSCQYINHCIHSLFGDASFSRHEKLSTKSCIYAIRLYLPPTPGSSCEFSTFDLKPKITTDFTVAAQTVNRTRIGLFWDDFPIIPSATWTHPPTCKVTLDFLEIVLLCKAPYRTAVIFQ